MPLTRYAFNQAVSAFFEMPTEMARELIPSHLEPLEVHHGSAVLAITAFDFSDSEVGPYQEIVLAAIVPPLVQGGEFPKSAFYPFVLGTSTPESREHAIERWHLPHYMKDVQLDFKPSADRIDVRVREGSSSILEMRATAYEWEEVNHLYQSFMDEGDGHYKVNIHMQGRFTEHEEERGWLKLHDHPMCNGLDADEIDETPFRELWMQTGVQTFEELESI